MADLRRFELAGLLAGSTSGAAAAALGADDRSAPNMGRARCRMCAKMTGVGSSLCALGSQERKWVGPARTHAKWALTGEWTLGLEPRDAQYDTTRSGGGTVALRPPVSAGAAIVFQRALVAGGCCLPTRTA